MVLSEPLRDERFDSPEPDDGTTMSSELLQLTEEAERFVRECPSSDKADTVRSALGLPIRIRETTLRIILGKIRSSYSVHISSKQPSVHSPVDVTRVHERIEEILDKDIDPNIPEPQRALLREKLFRGYTAEY